MTTARPTTTSAGTEPGLDPGLDDTWYPLYHVLVRLSRLLRNHTPAGQLTLTQVSTLAVIEVSGPIRLGDLAVRLGITAPTTSRMVESLCEREMVGRRSDPCDQRATQVLLHPAGSAVLEALREHGTEYLVSRLAVLQDDQLRTLVAALPALERLAAIPGEPDLLAHEPLEHENVQ